MGAHWWTDMRLAALIGTAVLVLGTLLLAVPQIQESNTEDHMQFTREISSHQARIVALETSVAEMRSIPERMARIEERLDLMGKLLFGMLAGVFGLLFKELWEVAHNLGRRLRTTPIQE